jgi:hypothetical protein
MRSENLMTAPPGLEIPLGQLETQHGQPEIQLERAAA